MPFFVVRKQPLLPKVPVRRLMAKVMKNFHVSMFPNLTVQWICCLSKEPGKIWHIFWVIAKPWLIKNEIVIQKKETIRKLWSLATSNSLIKYVDGWTQMLPTSSFRRWRLWNYPLEYWVICWWPLFLPYILAHFWHGSTFCIFCQAPFREGALG